jgi:predicted metalloprotease
LVLFRNYTQSGCGGAESATGPFYCPGDERCISISVFTTSSSSASAPLVNSRKPTCWLIEIGHQVQNILGIERRVQGNSHGANSASVRLELQADCFAGIWAHSTQQRGLLEKGDVQSALGAAAAVGDDRLQKMSSGHVAPDSFRTAHR